MVEVTVTCETAGCVNERIPVVATAEPGGRVVCGPCGTLLLDVVPGEVVVTWEQVRAKRDGLLAESDWTQVADAPVDSAAWAVYRQALRDIPQTYATPDEVVWPETPQ